MFRNYLKIGIRSLLKNKTSTIINMVGLSLGVVVCMVILIFVQYESSFDDYHAKAEQSYRVVQHTTLPNETLYWNTTAYPLGEALRSDFPEIENVTQVSGPVRRTFKVEDNLKNTKLFDEPAVLFVDSFYPRTFDVKWLAGDQNTALKETNSVVLTKQLAEKFFRESSNFQTVLGKVIYLQSKDPLLVTGVVENQPANSDHQYSMLIPYEFFKINNQYATSNWSGNYQGSTFITLHNKSGQQALETNIDSWKKKYLNEKDDKRISYKLQPLNEMHTTTLYGQSPGGYIMPQKVLTISLVVGIFILLLAMVNFINLLTAQSNARAKEVGVRKVMGGNRRSLVFQFILENSLVILIALLVSALAISFSLDFLNNTLTIFSLNLQLEWGHLGFMVIIGLFIVCFAALYPAVVVSAFKPVQALKNKMPIKSKNQFNQRKSLVTFQFIIVQLFLIAAIVISYQMNHFNSVDLGFSHNSIVITEAPQTEKSRVFREKLLANSAVSKVSFGSGPPMAVDGFQLGTNFRLPEQAEEEALEAEMKVGDSSYLDFYDLELLAGRNFLTNKEEFDEFIVNETFLKSFGWKPEQAIGKKIQINEGQATIVGVVKDFHNNSLQHKISPCIILNWAFFTNKAFIKVSNGGLSVVETVWKDVFTNSVYKYNFLNDSMSKEYHVEQLIFAGFRVFAIIAILIACLGLFGLMSFLVARKRKEISIRKVLGASLTENLSLFTKEYTILVVIAFVFSAPVAYYFVHQWLESFTYRIDLSYWMFLLGGFITLAIALVTCSFQSLRASMANPIKALREE